MMQQAQCQTKYDSNVFELIGTGYIFFVNEKMQTDNKNLTFRYFYRRKNKVSRGLD